MIIITISGSTPILMVMIMKVVQLKLEMLIIVYILCLEKEVHWFSLILDYIIEQNQLLKDLGKVWLFGQLDLFGSNGGTTF